MSLLHSDTRSIPDFLYRPDSRPTCSRPHSGHVIVVDSSSNADRSYRQCQQLSIGLPRGNDARKYPIAPTHAMYGYRIA